MMDCGDMGDMKGMMSNMMEGCGPEMMMEMMPKCAGMMVAKIPKEKRLEFVSKMITTLVEHGCAGMTEKEKENFWGKIMKRVKT